MHSSHKSKGGPARVINALRYSIRGLASAFRHEAAFRQELTLAVVLLPLALWVGRNLFETVLLIGALVFVLVVELLNSALEAVADSVTLEDHPLIERGKDLGSAAVLLSIILAALIWAGVIWR